MNNEKLDYGQSDNTDAQQSAAKRRRFIHGVGAAVPLLMTIAPRSALAVQCLSPSAQASISLTHSRENRPQSECLGRSPGYWKNANTTHPADWNASGAANMTFGNLFDYPANLAGYSFLAVLENGNGDGQGSSNVLDASELGAHLVAAWCNFKAGKVPNTILSEETLKAMSSGAGGDGYIPVAGATPWYAADIVAFIKKTFLPDDPPAISTKQVPKKKP